ncbi:hypothetical protein [Ruicaihuangia caeni]|uniref:hypothetical protein n=1 Tax=Ruicaihuangia caeni TaxID=3042517 RepID=UPI00338D7800
MTTFQAFPSRFNTGNIRRHGERLLKPSQELVSRAATQAARLGRSAGTAWERVGTLPKLVVVVLGSAATLGLIAMANTAVLASIYMPRWQAFAAQLGFDL